MKVLFDTSVLVASMIVSHGSLARAFPWLKRAKDGKIEMLVCAHTMAELFYVLTALPLSPKIMPPVAMRLIDENVLKIASIVALSASDYSKALKLLLERNLSGGIVYDALIALAAKKAGAKSLLTLNSRDFSRLWSHGDPELLDP